MNAPLQIFKGLPSNIEAALRSSIERFGVLVDIVVDQHGRIIDGHHRKRLADELGVDLKVKTVHVESEEHARELATTLNADRRQLTEEERKKVVASLRVDGHSVRAIAGALGVGKSTVDRDLGELSRAGQLANPEQVKGLDGKTRPSESRRPPAKMEKPQRQKKPSDVEVGRLKEQLSETKESLAEMADLAASAKAFEEKAEFKEMQNLRAELRAVKQRRDELMRENAELKKDLKYWKKRAGGK